MKAVATRNGEVEFVNVDEPSLNEHSVLVQTLYSAISPGTELGLILNKSITEPHLLGYSAVGQVLKVGNQVREIVQGDMVACYGGPYVFHGERLSVPHTLCAKIPSNVSPKEAAFVGLGAIAIHGVRRLSLQFGESVAVLGLGFLGQLIAQLCQYAGYQVVATDMRDDRCETAKLHGVSNVFARKEEVYQKVQEISDGFGVDGVIISAHSLQAGLVDQALEWVAPRGKVVVVGNVKMEYSRETFFQKEADVLISRAAGPGRYDPVYENEAIDYPRAYVRWTEGRNLREYIRLLSEKRLNLSRLVTHEFPLFEATKAYRELQSPNKTEAMGVLLSYQ